MFALANPWRWVKRLCRPGWWTGPIFGKELRVASRRRRSYVLRCAYVLLLTIYVAMVWTTAVSSMRGGAMLRAQMQVAAHVITQGIVWWGASLLLGGALEYVTRGRWNGTLSAAFVTVPFAQALGMIDTALDGYARTVSWFGHRLDALGLANIMAISTIGYLLLSLVFAWRAVRGFRRRML